MALDLTYDPNYGAGSGDLDLTFDPDYKPKAESGDYLRGLKKYVPQMQEMYGAGKALAGKAIDSESLIKSGIATMQDANRKVQEIGTKPTDEWTGVNSVGDAIDWAQHGLGQVTGNLAESAVAAGAGTLLGGLGANPLTAAAGGVTGLLGKSIVKGAIKDQAEAIAAKYGAQEAEKFIAKGMAEDVAKKTIGRTIGQNVGIAGMAGFHGVGETGSRAFQEAGYDPSQVELGQVLPRAAGHAAAEFLGDKILLGGLAGKGAYRAAGDGAYPLAKTVAGNMAIVAGKEVPVEIFQTIMERDAAKLALMDQEARDEYINTAAQTMLFGVAGAPSGVRSYLSGKRATEPLPTPAPVTPEQTAQQEILNTELGGATDAFVRNIPSEQKLLPPGVITVPNNAGGETVIDANAGPIQGAAVAAVTNSTIAEDIASGIPLKGYAPDQAKAELASRPDAERYEIRPHPVSGDRGRVAIVPKSAQALAEIDAKASAGNEAMARSEQLAAEEGTRKQRAQVAKDIQAAQKQAIDLHRSAASIERSITPSTPPQDAAIAREQATELRSQAAAIQTQIQTARAAQAAAATQQATQGMRQQAEQNAPATEQALAQDAAQQELAPAVAQPLSETPANQAIAKQRTQHATQQAGVRAQQLAQEEVGDQPAPTVKVPRPMKVGGLRAARYSDEQLQSVVDNDSVPATSRRAAAAEIAWRQAEAEAAAQAEIAKSTGKASTRRAGESESDWLYRKAAEKNKAKAEQQRPSEPVSEVDAKDLEVVGRAVTPTGDLGLSIIREDAMPDMDKAGPKEVSKQSATFLRHVAKLFGKEIVFVGGMKEGGFYQSGNKIYLSTKSNINQLRVLGHEMLHALKRQNRASYDKLLEAVGAIATDAQLKAQFKDYFALDAEMNQKTGAEIDAWLAEPKNREMILEEMMADLSGNRWAESSFWESVFTKIDAKYGSEQAKGIIAKLRLALVAALNKLMSLVKGGQFSVDARVSEHLESIREALATGFADYAKAVKDKQVSEGGVGEVKFSGKQTNIENLKKLMTDREKSKVGKRNAERIVELFNVMPSEKEMAAVAYAGKAKRGWYKNSANALTHLFGSEARRFAGLLAALSPQVSVEVNTRNALRMWANWDASGRPTDKPSIMRLLGQSVEGSGTEASVMGAWVNNSMDALTIQNLDNLTLSGPKVNSFMLNLVGNWEEVTNDAWVANYALVDQNLFSGTGKSKDGSDPGKGAGYLAMNVKTRMAAKILSKETGVTWAPAEVQETIWSWAKTMLETLDVSGETRTAKQLMDDGVITDDLIAATPDFELLFRQEPYAGILRNAGMGSKLNSMPMPKHEDPGRAPFADEKRQSLLDEAARRIEFLQRQRRTNMQISWEAKPGRSTGILPNIFNAPLHIQQQYLADIFAEFDMLQVGKKLGIDMRRTLFGPSAWKGDVAAGAQTILQKIGIVADNMGSVKVDADSRKNLEVAASILGYVLNQEGVYWHYPIYRAPDNHAMYPTGVEVNFGRSLTTAEVAEFYGIVSRLAKHQDWAPANTPTGVRFLNFTSFNDNPAQQFDHAQFQAIIKRASGRLKSWADGAQLRDFTFDGDAIENNWKENPNGEDYRSRVGKAGRSDLLKWADDQLSPAIDRVNKRYADQYGWGPASRLERDAAATGATPDNFSARFSPARSDAAGNERAGGRDAAATGKLASYGQPSPGAVSVQGFHYSGTERKQLDGRYYGTGAKGREADRVFAADDKRLRERIYFYVDAGKGVTPEQGVGANGHTVNLNNLYDADKDGFVQLGVDPALRSNDEAWMNAFESAVIDAGFDGYLRDFGTQRAAVLIGRHSVPVTYVGTGKQTGAVNASEAQKPARRTDLPLGQMTGAEWKKLEPRATDLEDGKSYYRSDLKFSPARVQSENELPNQQPGNRTLDGAELKALRRAASRLERPADAVFLRVTEDGRAIATGPKGVRVPEIFTRFAKDNDLTFEARRNGEGRNNPSGYPTGYVASNSEPMPVEYREAGAQYFGEGNLSFDRTGKTRFSPAREYISEIEGRIAKIKASDNQGGLSMVEANLANIKRGLAGETVRDEQGNLLAPNGRKSKLTEQQYLQVRTPAFRKWFGDWLSFHNAKNGNGVWTDGDRAVSKIVDENGEPLVVYHGTEKGGFTVMRPDRGDKHRSPMLFAAATRQTARTYSWKGDEIDLAQPEFAGAVARKIGNDWFVVQKSGDPSEAYNVYGELVDVEQAEGYVSKKEAEYFRDNELEQYLRDRGEVQTGIYSMFLNIRDPIERDFEGANWDGNTNDMFEVLGEDGDNIYADDGRRLMPQDEAEALAEQNEGAEVSSVEWIGETTNTVAEEAKQYGQDGAIIRQVEDDGGRYPGGVLRPDDVFVFFDSNQAKSATQNTGAFSQKNDDLRYSPPRWYFSPLEKAFESAPDKVFGQAPQVKLWLAGNKAKLGLKDDEIFWTGINDYLDLQGKAKVTKADVLAYLDGNGVQVQEVVKGDVDYGDVEAWWNDEGGANEETPFGELSTQEQRDAADRYADEVSRYDEDGTGTKYASYQLPGGTNYRELLLTLPAAQKPDITASQEEKDTWRTKADKEYRSAHWEEPNILAHIRMNDRTDADGNKVLFIEELQSDWGQEGKKNGFGSNKALTDEQLARKKELQNYLRFAPVDTDGIEAIRSAQAEFDSLKPENKTPDAPFVTDTKAWLGLAVKRIMAYAAANGYEKVAFISGAQSADRYDLSKQVDSIAWRKNGAGSDKIVTIEMPQGTTELFINKDGMIGRTGRLLSDANGKQLDDVIGKEITEKVLSEDEGNLSGDGLKVGGSGMVAFYDRIVPQVVSDQLKKVGGKIEGVRINTKGQDSDFPDFVKAGVMNAVRTEQLAFTVTPKMSEPLPLFSTRRALDGYFSDNDHVVPDIAPWTTNTQLVDLAYLNGKPIRLNVGRDNGPGSGFGAMHIARNEDRDPRRAVEKETDDRGENVVRSVLKALSTAGGILHKNGEKYVLRLPMANKALVLADNGNHYSVITVLPAAQNKYGVADWTGRLTFPATADATSAEPLSPTGAKSSLASRSGMGSFVSARFDIKPPTGFNQPTTRVVVRKTRAVDPEAMAADGIKRSTPRSQMTGQPILGTWAATEVSSFDNIARQLQDKQIDTKRVVAEIRAAGKAIHDAIDPYLQEILYHGRAAKRTQDFAEQELRPLLQGMQLRGVSMQEIEDYLWAKHAPERNAQNAKTGFTGAGSGLTDAEARTILSGQAVTKNGRDIQLDAAKMPTYAALAQQVKAINDKTLDALVAYGLETQATIDQWKKTYQNYVPLMRDMTDDNYSGANNRGLGTGKGVSVRGAASKRALGSERGVIDIVANIAMQRERAITRGEKSRVSQATYGLAVSAPNPDFWLPIDPAMAKDPTAVARMESALIQMGIHPIDAQNIAREPVQSYIDPRTGMAATRINPVLRGREDVLATRINGEDKFLLFSSDERAQNMVRNLKNLDDDQLGGFLQTSAKITRWFAAVNTQYNPVFGLVNGVRDFGSAMLNLSSTPLQGKQKRVAGYGLDALRGIYADLRDHRAGRATSSRWALEFEEFAKEGGQTGYRDMFNTSEQRTEALADELKALSQGNGKWLKINEKNPVFAWLSDYNTAVENAFRVAAYKVAKESGMSKQQAAALAKNLTVNFNKKGLAATQTGALYAFFNAAVQGTARIGSTLLEHRGDPSDYRNLRLSSMGKKIVLGGVMLGVMQALMGALAGWDDDEPKQFQRERNLIIPLPGTDNYVSIPYPLGFHVLPNVGRIVTEFALSGFKDPGKRLTQLLGSMSEAFNPLGSSGLSLQTIAPTFADPLVALATNTDWNGQKIAKEDFNQNHPTPGWSRTKDTATPWSKALAYGLNYISGGGEYGKGLVSPTPDQIDYLIGQAIGGVGREAGKVAQTVTTTAKGEELPMYKIPVVGRFAGETTGVGPESGKYYDNLQRVGEHADPIKRMREDRKNAEVMEYFKAHPEARLIHAADKAQRDISELRTVKRKLEKAEAPQERINAISEQIKTRMRMFNNQVKLLEKEAA